MSKTVSITSFLKGGAAPKTEPVAAPVPAPAAAATAAPSTLDAFYASLTPAQRVAHIIAKKSLGTSYDPERTHDYKKFIEKK